ncbi:MAG: PDGLE domain-containing protein [Candidatus Omnitrophica bacterium]|nr:PDGLE domain-containing protein [Candidatus Omnitrophota bacterium]
MKTTHKLWMGILILGVLSPIGIFFPEHFKAGDAWGEWGTQTLRELTGYIPQGLEKLSGLWNAPLPDYAFKGWEEKGLGHLSFAYIISAAVGVLLVVLAVYVLGKFLTRKGE